MELMHEKNRRPEAVKVAVFRLELLPLSETFIRDQVDHYESFSPVLFGAYATAGESLARGDERVLYDLSRRGDRWALAFAQLTGVAPRVKKALAASGVRLVHAHFVKDAWFVHRAARSLGLPLVVTAHGYDVTALPRSWVYRLRARWVLSRAHTVAVSEFIADCARRVGATDVQVCYTGISLNAVESSPGEPKEELLSSDVLCVARLVEKKGVDVVVAAARLLPDVSFVIAGDGPLWDQLHRDCPKNVRFIGAVSQVQVRELLARTKVFVLPSRTASNGDAEGFGQVFLEAGRAARACVGTRHGGIPEAVVDGVTGVLVPESDASALARALGTVLDDAALREQLGAAGFARVRDHFDMRDRTAHLESLYQQWIN